MSTKKPAAFRSMMDTVFEGEYYPQFIENEEFRAWLIDDCFAAHPDAVYGQEDYITLRDALESRITRSPAYSWDFEEFYQLLAEAGGKIPRPVERSAPRL